MKYPIRLLFNKFLGYFIFTGVNIENVRPFSQLINGKCNNRNIGRNGFVFNNTSVDITNFNFINSQIAGCNMNFFVRWIWINRNKQWIYFGRTINGNRIIMFSLTVKIGLTETIVSYIVRIVGIKIAII